jgi:RNA polymerase sigma factor (sigma-70 family)
VEGVEDEEPHVMIRSRRTTAGRELERLLRDGVRPALSDARLLERYILHRDEPAFETLVERHGPMVLSLCRRCLRDPRDVEDAFQATFLILVRKGSGLRDADSLSSWLYGVAYRVASRARSDVLKRRSREGEPESVLEAVAPSAAPYDDSIETLDAELTRLPEKYRAPLVLCYLEGRTHEQAAAELGWPVGTVRSRMARGRAILESRLTRRGLDASACLALSRPDFLAPSLSWTIPASLVRSTLEAAGRFVGVATLGGAAALSHSPISWPATALAQGVLSAMMISQLKWIGLGTAAMGLLAATAGMSARAVGLRPAAEDGPSAAPAPKPEAAPAPRPLPAPAPVATPAPIPDDLKVRLAELEQKLDRLTRLVSRLEEVGTPAPSAKPLYRQAPSPSEAPAVLPSPRPAPEAAPAAAPVPPAAAPAPPDPFGAPAAPLPPRARIPSRPAAPAAEATPAVAESPQPPLAPSEPAAPFDVPPTPAVPVSAPAEAPAAPPAPVPAAHVGMPMEVTTMPPAPARARVPSAQPVPVPALTDPDQAPALSPSRPATSDSLAALVVAPGGLGGVRGIQAQLQNLHERYKRKKALRDRGAISEEEYYVPIELARILVARLQEMDDELDPQLAKAELEAREAKELLAYFRERIEKSKELLKRFEGQKQIDQSAVPDLENARRAVSVEDDKAQEKKVARADLALEQLLGQRARIKAVIHWADERFDDLRRNEFPQ